MEYFTFQENGIKMLKNQLKQRNQGYKVGILFYLQKMTQNSWVLSTGSFRKVWKPKCSNWDICYSRGHDSRPLMKQRCPGVTCLQKGFEHSTVQYCVFFCVFHTYKYHPLFWVPQITNCREPSHAEVIGTGATNSRNVPVSIGQRHLWLCLEMPHNCTKKVMLLVEKKRYKRGHRLNY